MIIRGVSLDEIIPDCIETGSPGVSRLLRAKGIQVVEGGAHGRKRKKENVHHGNQVRKAEADMEENRLRKESESLPEWDKPSGGCEVGVVPGQKNDGDCRG